MKLSNLNRVLMTLPMNIYLKRKCHNIDHTQLYNNLYNTLPIKQSYYYTWLDIISMQESCQKFLSEGMRKRNSLDVLCESFEEHHTEIIHLRWVNFSNFVLGWIVHIQCQQPKGRGFRNSDAKVHYTLCACLNLLQEEGF